MRRAAALLVIAAAAMLPSRAFAQPAEPRLEVSGGALYLSGQQLADADANLTRNQVGGDSFTLFESDARVKAAAGIEGRVAWRVTRAMAIEGGVLYSRPQLSARIQSDVEGIPDATLDETLSRYIFDGAVVFHLPPLGGGRVVPFVRGGAGYLRELHEDNVLVETGQAYHAGGGVSIWFGARRRAGLRLDARVLVLDGGIDLGKGTRTIGAAGAAVVVGF
jgi:hypothetical protein